MQDPTKESSHPKKTDEQHPLVDENADDGEEEVEEEVEIDDDEGDDSPRPTKKSDLDQVADDVEYNEDSNDVSY